MRIEVFKNLNFRVDTYKKNSKFILTYGLQFYPKVSQRFNIVQ